ncbi:Vacuolar protein sorting-associated protein 8 [Lecanora helva]
MSAERDEAGDGPELTSKDDAEAEESSEAGSIHQSQQEAISSPGLQRENEFRNGDRVTVRNDTVVGATRDTPGYETEKISSVDATRQELERPSSADESLSIPDDTPSVQGSLVSPSPGRNGRYSSYGQSPTPSLRPFDRRFQARTSPSPFSSPRASSPAFLNAHSRTSSAAFTINDGAEGEKPEAPWEVVRWTKLRRMTGQALSEVGRRNFGRPTCIAIAASIVLGTSKGIILTFDYNQNLKSIIGQGTKAVESGPVTSISISADHSTIAAGHASGSIFTWEITKSAKPFLHIPPIDKSRNPNSDGHVSNVAILHIGFLGMRHTALASADDHGMAFSHLATRGMGVVARSVKTTRILGRYPEKVAPTMRQKKPSSVLSFSPLPLGNAEHSTDTLGLVALLTPYLLVIVSTTPIAQTQYKAPRPKEVAAHGAMTAALAWFPSVKLKAKDPTTSGNSSQVKLVYCWSNILTVLEILEVESSTDTGSEGPPSLQFKPRSRWKAEEAIVGVQWLGRSVLAVLTITQQLVILEDPTMVVTDSSDLIQKHIYHSDLFSPQLNQLVDQLDDEEVAGMHGVVADAFYMSFRAYKGRLFLLGYNEISFGTLSNWADRLLALMEDGNYIGAIQLATSYYSGEVSKVAVGLPEDNDSRHGLVQEKLTEMMTASLNYAFGKNKEAKETRIDTTQMKELSSVCIAACNSMQDNEFLFDDVYVYFKDAGIETFFIDSLVPYISSDEVNELPPTIVKDLVNRYTTRNLHRQLEELLCHLDPHTMDLDQITTLCKANHLYDALLYVWSQALDDHITIMSDLLDLAERQYNSESEVDLEKREADLASASKIFPYLSYVLTNRIYPTGKIISDDSATLAKAEIYHFFFSGDSKGAGLEKSRNAPSPKHGARGNFPELRRVLDFDAPSFLSMLNEAFEDSFLNGPQDRMASEATGHLTEEQKFGLSVNRQWIVSILLEVMTPPKYEADDTIYLDMFIARNLPKFYQFVLLPGHVLHRVLVGLCQYPSEEVADDCQLSVEYLLSIYQPPDLSSLIPLIHKARFYRVLKSIYKRESRYAELLETCLEDHSNTDDVFDCISNCLRPGAGLSEKQIKDVRRVIIDHGYDIIGADVQKAASTIDEYAPDLHSNLLGTIDGEDGAQYQYLQIILEPETPSAERLRRDARSNNFIEQYIRLLCKYNPSHVSEYVEQLETGDLRLEEVLPALESSNAVDAAVILMARAGKVREGIDRLTAHLQNLEHTILGLLDGADESPDAANTAETGQDLIDTVQKYARIGSWICQRQSKLVEKSKHNLKRHKSTKGLDEALSSDEELWLDLIDSVVKVTKNVTEVLERQERQASFEDDSQLSSGLQQLELSNLVRDLRSVVQDTFTSLLAATSVAHEKDAHRTDASFLRILRAFLSRASLSSPSLSNLRSVLGAIFSAYSYEESLLSLASRMLDKNLFVHVDEADNLRRRGWRPLGQVCEGCGRKIWGPGAGGYIWDAWQHNNEERGLIDRGRRGAPASRSSSREGKGKAATRREDPLAITGSDTENGNDTTDGRGPVVIFSCRHMFHRACLEKMQDEEAAASQDETPGRPTADLVCPLCR